MQDDDGRLVEAIADSWWDEHRRWALRFNKMRKGVWEAVRTLDPDGPISEENMRVIDLPSKGGDDAEAEFEVMRDAACARAVLTVIEREGWTLTPPKKIEGATFVCELPHELGEITGMRVEGDRIVCDTKSGIPFMLSATPKQGE